MQEGKFHPVDRVKISLVNTLYCSLCMCQVDDYMVYRTDEDRRP